MDRRNFITSLAAVAGLALIPKRLKADDSIIKQYDDFVKNKNESLQEIRAASSNRYVKLIDRKVVAESNNLDSLIIYWDNFPTREPYSHTEGVLSCYDINTAVIEFDCWTKHQNKWPKYIILGRKEIEQLESICVLRTYNRGFHGPFHEHNSGIPTIEEMYKMQVIRIQKESHFELSL